MSYISASNAGFSQAIVSFWFKVPQASLDKASATSTGEDGKLFDDIVPLVTMGKEGTGAELTHTDEDKKVHNYTNGPYQQCGGGLVDIQAECTSTGGIENSCCLTSLITFVYDCNCQTIGPDEYHNGHTYNTSVTGAGLKTNPSFIGVNSRGQLYVNFESANVPTMSSSYEMSGITPGSSSGGVYGECSSGTTSFGCDVLCCVCLIIECSNDEDNGNGEDNLVPSPPAQENTVVEEIHHYTPVPGAGATGAIYSEGIDVKPDQWHHVLVSVDLKTVATHGIGPDDNFERPIANYVDSASKLYIALDDKNYIKDDLDSNWIGAGGDNDVIDDGGWDIAGSNQQTDDKGNPLGSIPSYSNALSVPGGNIGMPAAAMYVDNVYHCEMAEFQMWTGQALDPKDEANRRLFLDYKRSADGTPIPDPDGKARLKPVDPKKAEDKLGKPTVVLHGSGKWKSGSNTGSGPKFTPTGIIKTYKPDPAILPAN